MLMLFHQSAMGPGTLERLRRQLTITNSRFQVFGICRLELRIIWSLRQRIHGPAVHHHFVVQVRPPWPFPSGRSTPAPGRPPPDRRRSPPPRTDARSACFRPLACFTMMLVPQPPSVPLNTTSPAPVLVTGSPSSPRKSTPRWNDAAPLNGSVRHPKALVTAAVCVANSTGAVGMVSVARGITKPPPPVAAAVASARRLASRPCPVIVVLVRTARTRV
jgi:hypothetical protein